MRVPDVRELLGLPELQAVQRYFDQRNDRVLKWWLAVSIPGSLAGALVLRAAGEKGGSVLWTGVVILGLLVLAARQRPLARWGRSLVLAFLLAHALALSLALPDPAPAYGLCAYALPALALLLRLRVAEHWGLALAFLAAGVWPIIGRGLVEDSGAVVGTTLGAAVWGAAMAGVAVRITRGVRERFLVQWRSEVSRELETSRMRGELRDAREIQLSMLPPHAPELDWVDFDGLSLPAAEVGGDYFDYFVLGPDRLAVVIADVAGHGVASGIVLSGMRSGLYLLREELTSPVEVLERLDRAVRETAPRRMFVTLQVAVLDRVLGEVTVVNAGHPPLIHFAAAEGSVRTLGEQGLPLGTRLEPVYRKARRALAPGDALVLYSDGTVELPNFRGEVFGERRLLEAIRRVAPGASARAVRDGVVNNLWRFKGDGVQRDDLTLVVVRMK